MTTEYGKRLSPNLRAARSGSVPETATPLFGNRAALATSASPQGAYARNHQRRGPLVTSAVSRANGYGLSTLMTGSVGTSTCDADTARQRGRVASTAYCRLFA